MEENFYIERKVFFSVFSNFEKIRYCSRFVCLSVRPCLYYFSGVGRSYPFMAQSKAYDPRAWTKEGIFFGPTVTPTGGVRSPISIHFHIKIRFYWYLRRVMSLMLDRVRSGSKVPPTQKLPPTQKVSPTQKVFPTQKLPPDRKI